eukprot:TRINITY_DN2208_c0_g3_i1.p1 TRINITY_DN2208_c0_g3~~TRINITY_DN2208_c0_g3_i1.p1  ORF type:complete len:1161 (+),score=361.77 TRINITY_DN2208_c0_g3_i1:98-3484(+)
MQQARYAFERAVEAAAAAVGCGYGVHKAEIVRQLLHIVCSALRRNPQTSAEACAAVCDAAADCALRRPPSYAADDFDDSNSPTRAPTGTTSFLSIERADFSRSSTEPCGASSGRISGARFSGIARATPSYSKELKCGYTRGTELGCGGFGRVCKAMDSNTGCVYAVKELVLHTQEQRDAAQKEYAVLKQLAHTNIVRVWDFHLRCDDSVAEIVMSYWTQGSIAHQLEEFGALPLFTVRKYVAQLLEGLGYLHGVTVLHRDVKPANALVDASGRVALTDFGLAFVQEAVASQSSETLLVGSPPYMSRNVVTGRGYSRGSDLWALGCSVMEMATALRPWSNEKVGRRPWGSGLHSTPWCPEQFIYAIASRGEEGTPLHALEEVRRSKLSKDLVAWLELCFSAERAGLTCRSLAEHEYLWTPAEKARRQLLGPGERAAWGTWRHEHFTAPSGHVAVYSCLHEAQFKAYVDMLKGDSAVAVATTYDHFEIRESAESPVSFTNNAVDAKRVYCCRKRPAHALAALIGRAPYREMLESDIPAFELQPPLMSRADDEHELLLDASVLDAVAAKERERGLSPDEDFDALFQDPERPDGPSAREIYGSKAFRITIGELKRMARTVHVELASDAVPRKFFAELVALTRGSKARHHFWSAHRAIALRSVGQPSETEELRAVVAAEVARAKEAEERLRSLHLTSMRDSLKSHGERDDSPPEGVMHGSPIPGAAGQDSVPSPNDTADSSMPPVNKSWSSSVASLHCGLTESDNSPRLSHTLVTVRSGWHAESFRRRRGENQVRALTYAARIARQMLEEKCESPTVQRVPQTPATPDSECQEVQRLLQDFDEWRRYVSLFPAEYGFPSAADARAALDLSLTELATHVCISEQGYLLVDGCNGSANQLHPRTEPITFLSAAGLDFMRPGATIREASKYFKHTADTSGCPHKGWSGFLPLAEHRLRERLKGLYTAVFASARRQGARNLSMLPMGMGHFLENLGEEDRIGVRRAYFQAQFELLCDSDWGFEGYYLNPGTDPESWELAEQVLESVLRSDGGRQLRCQAVVLHQCDGKFLAAELAKRSMAGALLNPSDAAGIMLGLPGASWELGRCHTYSAEQDLCAHSTSVISRSSVPLSTMALCN